MEGKLRVGNVRPAWCSVLPGPAGLSGRPSYWSPIVSRAIWRVTLAPASSFGPRSRITVAPEGTRTSVGLRGLLDTVVFWRGEWLLERFALGRLDMIRLSFKMTLVWVLFGGRLRSVRPRFVGLCRCRIRRNRRLAC